MTRPGQISGYVPPVATLRALRPDDEDELAALAALAGACRAAGARHGVPQPHDLTWLLAPADTREHAQVWEQDGVVVALALPRPAHGTVLFDVHPGHRRNGLPEALLEAALGVLHGECATPLEDDDPWRAVLLAAHGFADSGDGVVHLERATTGCTADGVEPLGGDLAEAVAAQHAAFGTDELTVDEREAWPREDGYRPELDLVVREGGRIVAFAVGYLRGEGVEVGTVGVRPEARGRGLARRLLEAECAIGAGLGAERAWTSTATDNAGMLAVARSAGFSAFRTTRWWERTG